MFSKIKIKTLFIRIEFRLVSLLHVGLIVIEFNDD